MSYIRPDSPVGQLKLFVGIDTAEMLHEVRQRVPRETENSRRLASVEHVHNVHTQVTLQPFNVAVGSVQYLV